MQNIHHNKRYYTNLYNGNTILSFCLSLFVSPDFLFPDIYFSQLENHIASTAQVTGSK